MYAIKVLLLIAFTYGNRERQLWLASFERSKVVSNLHNCHGGNYLQNGRFISHQLNITFIKQDKQDNETNLTCQHTGQALK